MSAKLASIHWQTIQSKKRVAKKTRLAVTIFLFIFVLLFIAQLIKFTKALYSPWSESRVNRAFVWQGDFNINLVIRAKDISLLNFNPKDQKITVIPLPDLTYLEATQGFGKWLLSSIYDLGQSQKDLGGGNLLKASLSVLFGLPVDGFLDVSAAFPQKRGAEVITDIRKSFFAGFGLLPGLKTDLTPLELLRLNLGLASVRFDKVIKIDLETFGVLNEESLADGTKVLMIDPLQLDVVLPNLADPTIKTEHKTIAIFNATDHPYLAKKWARLISNIGADVIITASNDTKLQTTQVLGEDSETLDRLRQIFQPACSSGKDEGICGKIDPAMNSSSRAQINIFLGEDFAQP